MEQKRVSFKVAKAIKEAGYPQEWNDCEYYYTGNGVLKRSDNYEGNSIEDIMNNQRYAIPAPYYLDVWLWLWQRGIHIGIEAESYPHDGMCVPSYIDIPFDNPEEAIIAAIDYLVDNDLIK